MLPGMSKAEMDHYLAEAPEPQSSTLEALRTTILAVLPDADQIISYGIPTFALNGDSIAGIAAYKAHCSYFPMSGSVLRELPKETAGYSTSKGTLRFPIDQPLPASLVKKLIEVRLAQLPASDG